jgi:hypothetical protein
VIVVLEDVGTACESEKNAIANGLLARLTENEEVTLRRVAYGQSAVRTLRRPDLARLHQVRLIEDGMNGPRLTADGKLRIGTLPKAASLGTSSFFDETPRTTGRRALSSRR